MSIDWNAIYGEAKKSNESLGGDQTGQAKVDEAAELAALKAQKNYFDSLFSADKLAEQRSAELARAAAETELAGRVAAQGGGGMSETLRSSLVNNMQLANAQARERYDTATKGLASTYGTTAADIRASYARLMNELARQNLQDTREEGRYRYEAEEARRQYEKDHALSHKKFDVENAQWQAGHDMAWTQHETGKRQWQTDFDKSSREAQEKIDFARAEWELKKQQEEAKASAKSSGGSRSRSKGKGSSSSGYEGSGYYRTQYGYTLVHNEREYEQNKSTFKSLKKMEGVLDHDEAHAAIRESKRR